MTNDPPYRRRGMTPRLFQYRKKRSGFGSLSQKKEKEHWKKARGACRGPMDRLLKNYLPTVQYMKYL